MHSKKQSNEHSLIVGAGTTGLSVLQHLYGQETVTLIDTRGADALPAAQRIAYPDLQLLLDDDRARLEQRLEPVLPGITRAVVSPGLPQDHWLLQRLEAAAVPICTDIDLFFAAAKAPVVGITGTNGKSTVTSLVATLLRAVGVRAEAGGNLGPAALSLLADDVEAYVLELSSFQLARSRPGAFAVASILNIRADHLDYHGSMAAYIAAKQRIYLNAQHAVFARDDDQTLPNRPVPLRSSFGLDAPELGDAGLVQEAREPWLALPSASASAAPVPLLPAAQLTMAGRHNLSNALASLALLQALWPALAARQGQQPDAVALATALRSYRGLPHRCERIAELGSVVYINDSKATNVGATVAAIEGLRRDDGAELLLLLGGDGKGADFAPLRSVFARGVRAAFVYGAAAEALYAVLADVVPTARCQTLVQAVDAARAAAQPGDSIVLSPACASFDQFANFEARGDAFRQHVLELAA